MIQFNRKPLPVWYQLVMGCAEIVDGILRLVSIGYISSQLSFHFMCWHSLRELDTCAKKEEMVQ